MCKSSHTEAEITSLIKQAEAGHSLADLCRKEGFSAPTFYMWRAKCGGMVVSESKRIREVESDNNKLKKLLAEALKVNCRGFSGC